MRFTQMKKQYILYLFLEAWAISSHIFHEITAWVLAPENTTWDFPNSDNIIAIRCMSKN